METDYVVEADPYGLELDLMDSLKPGDVVIHSTDFGGTNAPWGELMSTVAEQNGAVGTVCDSQVRDCVRIVDMGFPGLLRRHPPAGQQGACPRHGLRCAGHVRRGVGPSGRTGLCRL